MTLSWLDWSIILLCLSFVMTVGFLVSKIASQDVTSFFLANRNMPWWLLGLSMVATTFSVDTPNLVTDIVRQNGVSGNWVWMSLLITGMITTFIYAQLWRRLGVATDNEFYEGRYSGRPARILRGFRAVYLGFFFNVMVMSTVSLAALKIGSVMFDIEPGTILLLLGFITVIFSIAGGFLGVLITDAVLFVLAMLGSILAAYYAVTHPEVGGLTAMLNHPNVVDKLSLLPDLNNTDLLMTVIIIPFAVQWWSVWYPGAEPGGGGYVAQRMLAAKDENHAVAASAFFNFCHYALRPWPWILVALASLIVFPDLASISSAFPSVPEHLLGEDLAYSAMLTFLPEGVLGLVIASLMAAFISTMSTQLNWGSSYLVNDMYARFINPDASQKKLVFMARTITAFMMLLSVFIAFFLESALQAFRLLMTIGAGTGLLFLLRWFWMRINVWSEISAMVISFVAAIFFEFGPWSELIAWQKFLLSIAVTTIGWVSVTLLTPREDQEVVDDFYQVVHYKPEHVKRGGVVAVLAIVGTYATLLTIGMLLYGLPQVSLLLAVASALAIGMAVRKYKHYAEL